MANKNNSQWLRVTTSQKIDDRFLAVQRIFPDEDYEKDKGELFVLIEITRPWYPNSQIGARIISTFKKAFYQSKSSSNIVNFENSVKKVNDMLLALTEQGETEWIGRINAVLGAMIGSDIHLSSTGDAKVYLFRDNKSSLITEKIENGEIHPVSTFSSITSGRLSLGDTIVMSNPVFFELFDLPYLKSIITKENTSIYDAGKELAKNLKKAKINNVNSLFIRLSDKDNEPGESEVIYLDHTIKNTIDFRKFFKEKLFPFSKNVYSKSNSGISKIYGFSREILYPKVKTTAIKFSSRTTDKIKSNWDKARPIIAEKSKVLSQKIDSTITGIKSSKNKTFEPNNDPADSIIGKSIYTIHDYQNQKKQKVDIKLIRPLKAIPGALESMSIWIKNLKYIIKKPKRQSQIIALGVVVLILVLIASIALQKRKQINQQVSREQKQLLSDAKQKLDDGKTAIIFGDKDEAQLLFGNAIKDSQGLLTSALSDDASQIINSAQEEYDKLTSTKRYANISPIVDNISGNFLRVSDGKGIIISDNKFFETGLTAGAIPEQVGSIESSEGKNIAVSLLDNQIISLSNVGNIYKYLVNSKKIDSLTAPENEKFKTGKAMATFANNIYILDPENNQIWKYSSENDKYSNPSEFIPKENIDLKDAVDITIDGSVYALYSNGKIAKITRGVKENFEISGIPKPFNEVKKPIKIYTENDASSIFILDSGDNRLLEFDKSGQFAHQYAFPSSIKNLVDFVVEPKGRIAYILADNSLYKIDL